MQFQAKNGQAHLDFELPTPIGSTSDVGIKVQKRDNGNFGSYRLNVMPDDWGTLVIDYSDEKLRTPLSARFCHFFWHKDKLILREGLDRRCLNYDFRLDCSAGLMFTKDRCKHIYYAHPGAHFNVPAKHVGIFHLLRFLEGKMNLEKLDALANNE